MGDKTAGLREAELAPTWLDQLRHWLHDAADHPKITQPTAMVLATATPDATPSARTVLLKELDEDGLAFFTNLGSRKAAELAANPRASAVLAWVPMERQVVVCGTVTPLPRERVERYARSRPRGSQLSAWASRQSSVVADRAVLEGRRAELAERWPEPQPLPVPPFWGGFLLVPETVEFWAGRPDRLHDRLRFRRDGSGWAVERLAP